MPATGRSIATALILIATGPAAAPASAQSAYTYVVREAGGALEGPGGEATSGHFDVEADRSPMRVVQGPELTWVVPEGDSLTMENAALILSRNVPVRPGPGPLMVRGWHRAPAARYDTFAMELVRGDRDREVAGRDGRHYQLRAAFRRSRTTEGTEQRYEYTADFWILPDLPHSWAPFGYGTRSLPRTAPRLRDELDDRLSELGLVARAVTRLDYALIRDGEPPDGSRHVRTFEISQLERTEAPPAPGPVVDRSVIEALEERVRTDPGPTCLAVARGEAPDGAMDGVPSEARTAILAGINDRCSSPEPYFTMLEDRLENDAGPVCAAATSAADAGALADAIFTKAERAAFLELLDETDRQRFHADLRRYCEARR